MQAQRPENLPDFGRPPLNEVVIGVQFSPPKGYQPGSVGEVWKLYEQEYPQLQAHPALEPTFETFGLPHHGQMLGQLSFIPNSMANRFWFVKAGGEELIQFQADRLLHNWRKIGDQTNEYPRFEHMFDRFRSELQRLEQYFSKTSSQELTINQCEISYVNHISTESGTSDISAWLRGISLAGISVDDLNVAIREVILGDDSKPTGRITYEISTGVRSDGRRLIILNLTARGRPDAQNIDSALRYIAKCRELIVQRFAQITTEEAHDLWDRRA
ncbi:MAG: TIGR04255 family protein [Aestuariivirga sp.]